MLFTGICSLWLSLLLPTGWNWDDGLGNSLLIPKLLQYLIVNVFLPGRNDNLAYLIKLYWTAGVFCEAFLKPVWMGFGVDWKG